MPKQRRMHIDDRCLCLQPDDGFRTNGGSNDTHRYRGMLIGGPVPWRCLCLQLDDVFGTGGGSNDTQQFHAMMINGLVSSRDVWFPNADAGGVALRREVFQ
jgi:hypothetical protein